MSKDSQGELKRVMVVDDEDEWREFSRMALADKYSVICCATGDEALAVANTENLAAIILDVMMPGEKDGFTTFCDLRSNPKTESIPILILTAVNEAADMAFDGQMMGQFLGSAPAVFLEKPIAPEALAEELDRIVG